MWSNVIIGYVVIIIITVVVIDCMLLLVRVWEVTVGTVSLLCFFSLGIIT